MTQESYKLDLEMEVQQKVLGADISLTVTYERVDLDQMYEIVNKHLDQGNIIKTITWR